MYSNKENVNILTALLVKHGVMHAVVCPGSRNAPIVHNLSEHPKISCHNITDERSAGFYAIGLAQATGRMVAVCVTSGTALLNLLPAVAEARYQHLPLIIISADRPQQWIDQLDGQTLPQQGALQPYVRHSVTLPEPSDDEERWFCNRLVNEALCLATHRDPCPVHINVPITEPMFQFNKKSLPKQRVFTFAPTSHGPMHTGDLDNMLKHCHRPMFVFGCNNEHFIDEELLGILSRAFVTFYEPLLADAQEAVHFDEVLAQIENEEENFRPDFIIYIGGTLVSKRLRHFLRRSKAPTLLLTLDGRSISDPTMHLSHIMELDNWTDLRQQLERLAECCIDQVQAAFVERWHQVLRQTESHAIAFEPAYSQMAAIKYFEEQLYDLDIDVCVHYANSTAVRLACIYAQHHVWCNRGVNGIEGSLSTAAGFSLGTDRLVVCVVGDLSFFYDQNALWNAQLRGNLRIILLNNHRGGIFGMLPGLNESLVAKTAVAGQHATSARGICDQCDIGYLSASNMEEMQIGIISLLTRDAHRPMVLEVITDADTDNYEMQRYYKLN